MLNKVELKKDQISYVHTFKETVRVQKEVLGKLVRKMYEIKNELSEEARKLETVFDSFNNIFEPYQIGMGLCYIEKYRFEKGFNTSNWISDIVMEFQSEKTYYNLQNPFSK